MIPALRSETVKLLTVRSTLVYLILLTGSLYGPVVLIGIIDKTGLGTPTAPAGWSDLLDGVFIFVTIALISAASQTSSDIKHNLVSHAFLTQPRRSSWLVAKTLVQGAFVAAAYVVGAFASVCAVAILGGHFSPVGWSHFFAGIACAEVLTVVGIGFAALVRSGTAAVGIPLVWFLVIENLIYMASLQFDWAKTLFAGTISKAYGDVGSGTEVPQSVAVLCGWLVVVGGLGLLANQRRDIR